MPPPSSRMTKNQGITVRYRPGKAEVQSESEDESSSDENTVNPKVPPPKASAQSVRRTAGVILSRGNEKLKDVSQPISQPKPDLEGFVTASESSSGEEESGSDDEDAESEEESESSEEESRRPMIRPTFIPKAKRNLLSQAQTSDAAAEQRLAEEERRRKEKADEMLQAQIEKDAAARAAGRKAWDDDAELEPEDQIDDEDDRDPEAEHAAWKLRELKRVRRDRLAIIEKEKEREEIERRRNLTTEEREAEDKAYIDAQEEEHKNKGKMAFMQRYHHKGAFFQGDEEQDEEVKAVLNRDIAGARFEDEAGDKSVLPEYMKIRDMTRLGRKGRTRYKDLKSEDTGSWGEFGRRRRQDDQLDDRFRPDDRPGDDQDRTGANTAPLGERRRRDEQGGRDGDQKRARYD